MPKYLLLLHDDMDAIARISPEEMQRVIADYAAWSERLARQGRIHGGEKLRDEGGRHLTAAKGKTVVRDGPYAEAKEVIGGYFVIEARDYDEAVALCDGHPHLALGGRIELREIEPLG